MTDSLYDCPPGLDTALKWAMKTMNFVIVTAGIVMALTFFFVVILRYWFNADLFAYEEWLMALCFWMFFLAAAAASHDRAHINADILGVMITDPKLIWRRALLVQTIELIVLFFVTYWAFLMIQEEIAAYPKWQTTIALKIPFLVPRLGIFFGFVMMTVYTALYLYTLVKRGPSLSRSATDHSKIENKP